MLPLLLPSAYSKQLRVSPYVTNQVCHTLLYPLSRVHELPPHLLLHDRADPGAFAQTKTLHQLITL